jgi:SAM-dependent methyltransferase
VPRRLVISDQSSELLAIARTELRVPAADYLLLDVQRTPFPFEDASFDLVLAGMLFNELPTAAYAGAAAECARVLAAGGQLIATVPHPDFVRALARKGELTDFGRGLAAMPGAEGLRLPVSRRPRAAYLAPLEAAGFAVQVEDVAGTPSVRRARPGLRAGRGLPLALLLDCRLPDTPDDGTPRG